MNTKLILSLVLWFWLMLAMDAFSDVGINNEATSFVNQYYSQFEVDEDIKIEELEKLLEEAERSRDQNLQSSAAWFAVGLIRAGYAKNVGGLKGLSQLKKANKELSKSIELNEATLDEAARAVLARLYISVPKWPLAFGDKGRGLELLEDLIKTNPNNKLALFYLGQHWQEEHQFDTAKDFFTRSIASPMPCKCNSWRAYLEETSAAILHANQDSD